jgi:hypothetical protein
MRNLKRICAGMVLTLAFGLTTFAGQIPCDGKAEPPPPPPTAAAATEPSGEMDAGIVEALATFLLSMF